MTPGSDDFVRWLETLGLERHAPAFARNDVGFEAIGHLTDADLQGLGLSLGHRRILQGGLDALRLRGALTAPRPMAGHGERRQITVMFCDLVGSTQLSRQLDPEDLARLHHAYYSTCCRVIEQGGGFIARLLGDGILSYFGYPAAREDAAECAIRAALDIVAAIARESTRDQRRLEVRIGLATGVSVISDMVGTGFSELHAVMGETPNRASRIQALAAPGTVAVAEETRRLAANLFVYADAGAHALVGFDRPVQVWRVVGESASGARFDPRRAECLDLIGRDGELAALLEHWRLAQQGGCRVVTLGGDAGIGKSRLLRSASGRFMPPAASSVLMQCSPSQAATPLHPLIDWLRRDTGVDRGDEPGNRARLAAWLGEAAAPVDLALVGELLRVPLPGGAELANLPPDRKRDMMREVVLRHFDRLCDLGPALLVVEDAHWMDGATAGFLASLFERMRTRPLLVIITARPECRGEWSTAMRTSDITLEPLTHADAERLVRSACRGQALPQAVMDQILARTDGVPLFIEELTATILESGLLREQDGPLRFDAPLPAPDIPCTLRDSLMARLDRLSDVREVARVGSALGREFTFALLSQVTGQPAERLAPALARLVDARLLFQRGVPPDAEYTFKHALVQQAAYEGQLRSDRQSLHARIVHAIETHQPELARREPGLMAHHCRQAGMTDREVDYLQAAGLASTRIVAIPEALACFERADAAIAQLEPDARNARRGIDILLGMMEVGRFAILPGRLVALSARARALSRREGVEADAATIAAILFQDGRAKLYSSRYAQAREIFGEIRQLGIAHRSRAIERKPASAFGMALCCQGRFSEALEFINEGNIGYYKDGGSFIDYIAGLGWIGYASCQAGGGDAGLRFGDRSVREAELVQSQIYLAGAHVWRSHALMSVRRLGEAAADARRCVELSRGHAVPYLGWHGLVFLSLCESRRGCFDAAAEALGAARALLAAIDGGQWSLLDYLPAIEAEIACFRGEPEAAIRHADEAIALAAPIGGHFAEAVAWRAKAVAGLRCGMDADEAQSLFERAMTLHELGGARAEATFSAEVWGRALAASGQAGRARRWLDEARSLASRHAFDLARCEYAAGAP